MTTRLITLSFKTLMLYRLSQPGAQVFHLSITLMNYLNTPYVIDSYQNLLGNKICYFLFLSKDEEISVQRVKCFTEAHANKMEFKVPFLKQLCQLNKNNFQLYNSSSDASPEIEILSNCLSNISIWTCHNYFSFNLFKIEFVITS